MKLKMTNPRTLVLGLAALLLVTFAPGIKMLAANVVGHAPAPAPAFSHLQNDNLDFELVNKTGYTLKSVLIGPSKSDSWDDADDVLNGRRFPDGATLKITFSPKLHAAHWDMKVVYSIDGSSHEFIGLKLDEINTITLHYNADKDKTYYTSE